MQVAAEERAKWDAEKATFLSRELEGERTRLNEEKVRQTSIYDLVNFV